MKLPLPPLAALSIAALASACGSTSQSTDTVFMTIQNGGMIVSGTYRTEGFSQGRVRSMVGRICTSAGFSGFNQTVTGTTANFSASCSGQTKYNTGGNAVFMRQEDGRVTYTISYAQNGRPLQEDGNL